jgi:hypothetical protein
VVGVFKSKMAIKWNNEEKLKAARKFDVEKLKEEKIWKKYRETVDKKLKSRISSAIEELEDKWNMVKNSIIETAESVVQFTQKPKRNKWFNERCRKGIHERNNARNKAIQLPTPENIREFEIKRKEVTKLIRKEKKNVRKSKIKEIERYKYNPREFFKRCKAIKSGFFPHILSLVDKNCALILPCNWN